MDTIIRIEKKKVPDLHPTQMTVGFRAVKHKRKEWKDVRDSKSGRKAFLESHVVPVVFGPEERAYATDHHHVGRALYDSDEQVWVAVHADLSDLPTDNFWNFMDQNSWCRPCDSEGKRHDFSALPKDMMGLVDDPYRSLAAAVQKEGAFAKDGSPFEEFLWADFFRSHIRSASLDKDFPAAVGRAAVAARSKEAAYLPGWSGHKG